MSEFTRWIDESSDASDVERAVLRSDLGADPTASQENAVWAGILSSLALTPLGPAAAPGAALKGAATGTTKASAVLLGVAKGFIVALALYGGGVGLNQITGRMRGQPGLTAAHASATHTSRASLAVAPSAANSSVPIEPTEPSAPTEIPIAGSTAPKQSAPPSTAADLEDAPLASASEAPSVATFADVPPRARDSNARSSQLEGEASALRVARSQLRTGQLADAFNTLEASRRRFSAPELAQEREALMIELLSRNGQIGAARERAKAFLAHYPDSPHAGHVRQFTTE